MDLNVFNEKKEGNLKIKEKFWFQKKDKCCWLVKLADKSMIIELRDAFLWLPACFVIEMEGVSWVEKLGKNIVAVNKIDEKILIWFDFIICDNNVSSLKKYLEKGIAPIISRNNPFKSILSDFDPIKNTGNAFIYDIENKWWVFQGLIRYLENYKFPFDNKNLVKKVLDI